MKERKEEKTKRYFRIASCLALGIKNLPKRNPEEKKDTRSITQRVYSLPGKRGKIQLMRMNHRHLKWNESMKSKQSNHRHQSIEALHL